ncbi:MAG: SPOR domain-containing protein [Desulfuromonadales bacterium]
MRIDYSEPKKSCSSPHASHHRPRKESSGGLMLIAFTGLLCLGIGFGSGWMLSQRSAKKGFKLAMEQQSLENSPQQAKAQPLLQQPAAPPAIETQSPKSTNTAQQQSAQGGTMPNADPPLSFYKTLPSGQKSNVLGSGINAKEEKQAKQPLQAAMPANMAKPVIAQADDNSQKTPNQAAASKTNGRQDPNGFTVQVASYSLKSEAEATRSKLATKGYNVCIVDSHLGDKGTWYRVRVGKHLDQDGAKELAGKLGKGAIAIPDKD